MTMSLERKQRMIRAIELLQSRREYPSAARIAAAMGRKNASLSGNECILRRAIFAQLGIKIKGGPYA